MAFTGAHSSGYGRNYDCININHHCGYDLDVFVHPDTAENYICTMYEIIIILSFHKTQHLLLNEYLYS